MLTISQIKVLQALNDMQAEGSSFDEITLYNRTKVFDRKKMLQLCKGLKGQGYLETLVYDNTKTISSISLSYKGMSYKTHALVEFVKECALPIATLVAAIAGFLLTE